MKILVTGAAGFVGKNLVAALKNLQKGLDRTRPGLSVAQIFEYDLWQKGQIQPLNMDFCNKT